MTKIQCLSLYLFSLKSFIFSEVGAHLLWQSSPELWVIFVFSITSFGYWLLLILFPECTFEGLSSSKAWCLSADCVFLYVLCKKTNLSPFFRGAEGAEFIAKVTRNPLTGYVSSWQLGKILLSVSLHERSFIFPPLSLSGNILTFSNWKKTLFPGILENSDMFEMKSHWRRIYQIQRHCWGLYFFKEDILSRVDSQERKTALADFSVEFLLLFLLFFLKLTLYLEKKVQSKKDQAEPKSCALECD